MGVMGPPREPSGALPGNARSTAKTGSATPAGRAKAARPVAPAKVARAKATKAPATRTRTPAARPRVGGQEEPAADGPAGPHRQRRDRSRVLYSRPIQRGYEHWPLATRVLAALLRHPGLVLAVLGTRAPVERDGRVLNRNTQAMVALADRYGTSRQPPPDPATMRNQARISARAAMPVRTDVHVSGRIIPGDKGSASIPVWVYRKFGGGGGGGPGEQGRPPAIVYFHGGGWTVGDLDTHDGICRLLAATSRCLVVSVGYRLAPEHPFPAAVDDCLAAYAWVHRNGDELGIAAGRVGVMGDSAGGTLAAVVAQQTLGGPDDVPPPWAQCLIYPASDSHLDTASLRSVGDDFLLTHADMEFFRQQYLPDRSRWNDPRASPLLADDLTGLAPALVVTAGFDPLRDDGLHYAEALRKGGVDVEYRCYHDQIHGFMNMGILPDSFALATEVCDAMGRLMRRSAGVVEPWS